MNIYLYIDTYASSTYNVLYIYSSSPLGYARSPAEHKSRLIYEPLYPTQLFMKTKNTALNGARFFSYHCVTQSEKGPPAPGSASCCWCLWQQPAWLMHRRAAAVNAAEDAIVRGRPWPCLMHRQYLLCAVAIVAAAAVATTVDVWVKEAAV